MPQAKYRPRIVIECSQEQKDVLTQHLAFGMQHRVLGVIIDDVTELLNEFGDLFVLYMLERRFSYRAQMEEYANRRFGNTTLEPAHTGAAVESDPSNS